MSVWTEWDCAHFVRGARAVVALDDGLIEQAGNAERTLLTAEELSRYGPHRDQSNQILLAVLSGGL